jgi:hypothetical protein
MCPIYSLFTYPLIRTCNLLVSRNPLSILFNRVSNRSATVQSVRQLGFFASVSQLRIILESVSQLE